MEDNNNNNNEESIDSKYTILEQKEKDLHQKSLK